MQRRLRCRNRINHMSCQRRRGLAPLELVLSLPIMLFVMGLMIIFGTSTAWKVRTHANSRQAVWRTFTPRSGQDDPVPSGWPESAEMSVRESQYSVFDTDSFADFEVIRGPFVTDPETGHNLDVLEQTMDPVAGTTEGVAHIERGFPVLGALPPEGISFTRVHTAFDDRWQFWNMGMRSNRTRRVRFMYRPDLQARNPAETNRYVTAALAIVQNPNRQALTVLDRDDELAAFNNGYIDFHPRIPQRRDCTDNPEDLRRMVERRLQDISPGVPQRLTREFLRMYQSQLSTLESQLNDPQTPPGQRVGLQSQISGLETKIEQLEQFQSTLP